MRNGYSETFSEVEKESSGIPNPVARDLLLTETRVFQVFDQLASRIDRYLDYPDLLVENGVQGESSLDLYFDHDGNIDEMRSRFTGGHRVLRGLLVQAVRQGLIDWYQNDADRIERKKFRNQHFRADFALSSGRRDLAQVEREPGGYGFTRRRYVTNCISGLDGTPFLNLACVGMKVAGSLHGTFSGSYRSRFEQLKDRLGEYDDLELHGLNERILQRAS